MTNPATIFPTDILALIVREHSIDAAALRAELFGNVYNKPAEEFDAIRAAARAAWCAANPPTITIPANGIMADCLRAGLIANLKLNDDGTASVVWAKRAEEKPAARSSSDGKREKVNYDYFCEGILISGAFSTFLRNVFGGTPAGTALLARMEAKNGKTTGGKEGAWDSLVAVAAGDKHTSEIKYGDKLFERRPR